jgi:hypothetical protein
MRNKDNTKANTPQIIIMILTISAVSFAAGYFLASAQIAALISTQLN